LTGVVKSAFHASHVDGFEPLAVVERVSMGLAAFSPDRFVTLVAALISPEQRHLRYVNAGHPPILLWGPTREPEWFPSTGPLVSPVLTGTTWSVSVVPMNPGEHVLLYTDGVWEPLADEDGRAEERFTAAINRTPDGGAALLDTILADVHRELAGHPQPDDLTLLTASMIGSATESTRATR
jgi:phosphoserine phosphatase RsbU/P